MKAFTHAVLASVLACKVCIGDAGAQVAGFPGITFVVDTSPELTPHGPGVVKPLGIRVTYAHNRGRIDVQSRPTRPTVKIGETVAAPSLAAPGDYYLFDSTGFVLVRPSTKQFSTFHLADDAFNYEGRRDGWPDFFRFAPIRTDTIPDPSSPLQQQHGEQKIYWHLDAVKDTICTLGGCSIEELARGRTTVADAPAAELIVVRWFGPARALAQIPGGVGRLLDKPIRVTTVSPITGVHRLRDLRSTAVEPARLILPPDFVETPWPGFPVTPQMRSNDRGAKWRVLPAGRGQGAVRSVGRVVISVDSIVTTERGTPATGAAYEATLAARVLPLEPLRAPVTLAPSDTPDTRNYQGEAWWMGRDDQSSRRRWRFSAEFERFASGVVVLRLDTLLVRDQQQSPYHSARADSVAMRGLRRLERVANHCRVVGYRSDVRIIGLMPDTTSEQWLPPRAAWFVDTLSSRFRRMKPDSLLCLLAQSPN